MLHIDSGELLVIVHNTVKQNQVSSVDIKVQEGFDVASVLVNSGVASWEDDPIGPKPRIKSGNQIDTLDVLYVTKGGGGMVRID